MRTTMLFAFCAAMLVAACGDDPGATTSPRNASGSAAANVTAGVAGPSAQGKPVGPVALTKITQVNGNIVEVLAHQENNSDATCPAGSTVFGGTYHILTYVAAASPPWILNGMNAAGNTWTVTFDNEQPGADHIQFFAVAYCAS